MAETEPMNVIRQAKHAVISESLGKDMADFQEKIEGRRGALRMSIEIGRVGRAHGIGPTYIRDFQDHQLQMVEEDPEVVRQLIIDAGRVAGYDMDHPQSRDFKTGKAQAKGLYDITNHYIYVNRENPNVGLQQNVVYGEKGNYQFETWHVVDLRRFLGKGKK